MNDIVHRLRKIGEIAAAQRVEMLQAEIGAHAAAVKAIEELPPVHMMGKDGRGQRQLIDRAAVLELLKRETA